MARILPLTKTLNCSLFLTKSHLLPLICTKQLWCVRSCGNSIGACCARYS
ncbi:Uncharacterised protein [Vibrio cholerae]|nr:Uncharacterised protein [Vibrio cholerae]CSI62522.1 Uncharacterised protein [Vibrio cholerae]